MVFGCFVIMTCVNETTNFFLMALTSASHFATTFDQHEIKRLKMIVSFDQIEAIGPQVAYNLEIDVIWALFSTTIGQLNFVVSCPSCVRL